MATKKKKQQEFDLNKIIANSTFTPVQETAHEAKVRQDKEKKKKKEQSVFSNFNDGYDFGDVTRTILKGGKKVGGATVGAFKGSSYWDDGYQFGDIFRTTKATASDLLAPVGKGFLKASESISDWGYNKIGGIAWGLGFEDAAMENWQNSLYDSTGGIAQDTKHILAGDLGGNLSDYEVNKAYQKKYEKNKKGSLISRKGEEYAEEIARMATIAGYGALTGGQAGTDLLFYASAASNAENQARMAGASPEEAWKYSIMSGTAEMLTEKMFGGLGKISDATGVSKGIAEQFTKKLTNKITNTFFRNLAEYGVSALGEGFEEVASGFLDAYAQKLTYMKDADIKQLMDSEELMESFTQGAVTSFFMQLPGLAQADINRVDYKTGYTNNEQKVVDQLIQERVNEASKEGKVSGKKYAEIRDKVNEDLKNGDIKVRDIERILGGETYKNYQSEVERQNKRQTRINELQDMIDDYENSSSTDKLSKINDYNKWQTELEEITKDLSTDNTISLRNQLSQEVAQMTRKDRNFAKSYFDEKQKSVAFDDKVHKPDNLNDKQKALLESAKNANANNTKSIHKFVDGILGFMNDDKSINYEFVNDKILRETGNAENIKYKVKAGDTLESVAKKNNMTVEELKNLNKGLKNVTKGQEINVFSKNITNGIAIKKDNKVLINLDAVNRLETVVGHEMTHILENIVKGKATGDYGAYRDALFEYAESKGDLKELRNQFEKLYKDQNLTKEQLDEELTAELSGRYLFNDEKFLKLVAEDKSNTKIRDFIDDLVTKFTGTEEEKQLRELQKKYRAAYQEFLDNGGEFKKSEVAKTEKKKTTKKTDIAPIKEQAKETPKKFTEVTDEDLFNINMEEVENQFDKQEYKLNEDVDSEDSPFGTAWDLDDYNFKLKDGNTLWIETPYEYGKNKDGSTNYNDTSFKRIDFTIEDSNGEIIDEYSIKNEKGEFTRDDILNAIKHMTYDDSNKVADGQLDIFDNVHRNDGHRYSLSDNPKIFNEVKKYDSMEDFIFDSNISYDELESAGLGGLGEIVEYYNNKNKPILKDYKNTKESASFTEDRLDSVISESISDYDDNYARAYITHMSPEQFLGLTASEQTMERLNQETEELDVEKLAKERQHIFLDVNLETGKVTGHEGRHRMLALQRAGIKDVEMVIYPDSGTYDRSNAPRIDSMNLIGQDFRIGKGTDTTIGEMIPVSKATQNELRSQNREDSGIRYSLSVSEANTGQDNDGRTLSKGQQDYFKESKATDENGNLITVYHTTTDEIAQFNEFNPVGTPYYRFGDTVVNYYTDSKEMSGSYANQKYEMADTKKLNNLDEAKQWLKENTAAEDNFEVKETLDEGRKKKGEDYALVRNGIEVLHFRNDTILKDFKQQVSGFLHLFKDIENLQTNDKQSKIQYEGYVNITNPYVIDAEERNWNQVVQQSNEFIDDLVDRVPQEIKDNLTRLYQESENISTDSRDGFNAIDNAISSINEPYLSSNLDEDTRIANKIVRRAGFDNVEKFLNGENPNIDFWYTLASELEEADMIDRPTSVKIVDDYVVPDNIRQWLNDNYTKEIKSSDFSTDRAVKMLGEKTSLKDLYNKRSDLYENYDKYRYEDSYFLEKISSDTSEEGYVDMGYELNDIFETRAEIMGTDTVAKEIGEAAKNGFSKPQLIRLWGTSKTTNDIVQEIIKSNSDGNTNYDGVIIKNVYDYGGKSEGETQANNLYITFASNQFKAADNVNPTMDNDIRYSLSANESNEQKDLQTRINESMTMDDMKRILDMAFVEGDIKEYSDGEVQSVEDWINNDNWNYQISLIAENSQPIIQKYLNRMNEDSGYNEDFTFDDILEAYKNGTLTGPVKQSRIDLDTTIESGRVDNRFYAPQQIEMTKELYDKANQRVTNKNRDEVYKARADFIIAAHDKGMAEQLGLSQQEINKKLRNWANYPQDAVNISNKVNEGVARENQWSGLENSSIVNYISINDDQLKSMVKEIKGESSEFERKYITSAMLAIDTHIDYSTLTFEFGQREALSQKHANGDYDYTTDTIRVNRAAQNTIAHEMGHYINSKWARDIFGSNPMGSPLSDLALHYNKDIFKLSNEQKQFVDNFTMFIDDLTDSAVLSYGNNRGIDYWQNRDEVFARFVAKFTEWTKNKATNGRFDYESRYDSGFGDAFTTKQYMDFVKILQEKSALETMGDRAEIQRSISSPDAIAPIGNGTLSEDVKLQETQMDRIENQLNQLNGILGRLNNINPENQPNYSDDLSDLEINLAPFADMIGDAELKEANRQNVTRSQTIQENLKTITENYEKIKSDLVSQGLPEDAATNFLKNAVNKYDQEYRKQIEKTGKIAEIEKMLLTTQEMFTNRNAWIDKLSKDSGNENIKLLGDMANNSFQEASTNINRYQTDLEGKKIGKSIKEIFKVAKKKGLGAAFEDYLFNKSNIERHAVGKGSQVPSAVSEQLVKDYEASNPEFKTWAKDIETFYDNLLTQEVNSGLIDQDTYNLLRGEEGIYRSYVPFYPSDAEKRYFDDAGDLKPIKPLKRARGGASLSKLMGIEDAMGKQTMAVWNSIRTNQLYQEIINTIGGEEGFGAIIRNEPSNLSQSLYTDQDGNKFLTAYVDGREMTTKISDDLYNELSRNTENRIKDFEERYKILTKPLQKLSEFRRNVLTSYNPTFALFKNPVKDIQDAILYSKHTAEMLKGLPSAYKELWTGNTDTVQQFMALYGGGEYTGIGKGYAKVSEMIELAPRYAEFKASLKAGDSVAKAIYNARDITTNFGRGGYITKAMNRNGFTFLNASVQGFSKLVRNFTEQPNARQFAMAVGKAALFGVAPAVFNGLAFGTGDDKDEDYEALPDYIKDNYYVFKLGDNAEYDDGDGVVISVGGSKFLRIPKGRALSIFGSAARRTMEAADGGEFGFKDYFKNAWSQVGPVEIGNNPLDNTIVAPIAQAYWSGENGRQWYDDKTSIVPTRLQGEKPEDQYDEKVDKMSIWLGQKLGISPYKLNYVIDQYSGGLGDVILPMITEQTKNGAETPLDYLLAPVKDQLIVNSIDDNKYAGQFFSTKEKLYTGSKATDEDLVKAAYMNDKSWEMSALYKEKREIQSDSSLGKKEKYAKVQQVQEQINNIAKEAMKNYQDVTITDSYARVNDKEYYKNAEGEWSKIWDDDSVTVNSLGMTDSEKSQYFEDSNKIYSIEQKYKKLTRDKSDEEKTALNKKKRDETLDVLKKSALSDNAKYALYGKEFYWDKMTPYYEDLGFKANDVMTYKGQTFTADKDKYGDSINGTKQKKVMKYIDSMNIPEIQKAILKKNEYNNNNDYDSEIVSYIESNITDYSEKKKVLEQLGFVVNGNNVMSKNIAKRKRKR